MLRLLLPLAIAAYCVRCSCPDQFTLTIDGKCTFYAGKSEHTDDHLHSEAVTICEAFGATPIVIHNQNENDYWINITNTLSQWIPLGLRCNKSTKAWEWDDGSSIDYKNIDPNTLPSGNCANDAGSWYLWPGLTWFRWSATVSGFFDVYCMTGGSSIVPPDSECGDFMFDDEDGDCYRIGMDESFLDAQSICKSFGGNVASIHSSQENSFIRRLAVSKGLINGILIGATVSGKSDNFSWIDGSAWDFNNFVPGFPLKGLGDCAVMDTNGVDGSWVNVDCNQKMPYICVRRSGEAEPSCGQSAYTEGELIYSPGFPSDASVPCDYFLPVDANKHVEIEILLLEANSCCDHLVLYDGTFGGNMIANLTGEVASGTTYRTTTSNVMRVSWQPNGGVNVRGMMIRFRGV